MKDPLLSFLITDLKQSRFQLALATMLEILYDINISYGENKVWLAGGALRSLLVKEHINDYDLFFKDKGSLDYTRNLLTSYYGFTSVYKCPLGLLETLKLGDDKVQLITPTYFDNADDLLDSFDFTAAHFASDGRSLITTKRAIKDIKNKSLVLWRITHVISTMRRITKYTNRGYKFNEDQRFLLLDHIAANRWHWDLRWYID